VLSSTTKGLETHGVSAALAKRRPAHCESISSISYKVRQTVYPGCANYKSISAVSLSRIAFTFEAVPDGYTKTLSFTSRTPDSTFAMY